MRLLAPASYDAHLFTLEVGRLFFITFFLLSPILGRSDLPRVRVLALNNICTLCNMSTDIFSLAISQNKIRQLDKERGENVLCY